MKKLSPLELNVLFEALHYFHVKELKSLCEDLSLPSKGKKGEIIQRIFHFVKEGMILQSLSIPEKSLSKGPQRRMAPSSLILKGSYKNDEKTRNFFKSLIGDHFHFTAFGQDWIMERWIEGNPPTYGEFATFWEKEYRARKNKKAHPKQEWAYINFIQRMGTKLPQASQNEMAAAWEQERLLQKKTALKLLSPFLKS